MTRGLHSSITQDDGSCATKHRCLAASYWLVRPLRTPVVFPKVTGVGLLFMVRTAEWYILLSHITSSLETVFLVAAAISNQNSGCPNHLLQKNYGPEDRLAISRKTKCSLSWNGSWVNQRVLVVSPGLGYLLANKRLAFLQGTQHQIPHWICISRRSYPLTRICFCCARTSSSRLVLQVKRPHRHHQPAFVGILPILSSRNEVYYKTNSFVT